MEHAMNRFDLAIKRATRRFRCRDCGQLVRARWVFERRERVVDEHGTNVAVCPRSGHLVEMAFLLDEEPLRAAHDRWAMGQGKK